jgi:hypothetical protein
MRRWQTIKRGKTVERKDIYGRGVIRTRSDLIGLLYYRGFARPPRDVARLVPELVSDYRRRLSQLWQQVWHRPQGLDQEQPVKLSTGVSTVLPSVIHATQFVLLLLLFGMTMVGGAILLLTRAPAATSERAAAEYGAAFFFSLAVTAFKNGIVGQRKPDRSVRPRWIGLGARCRKGPARSA